ncbi:hypothetical protein ACVILI_006644 [Mesorhizobium sp. USDA 4775]|uniref:Uncharacterized protein n=1 Tax=Mesorhizobium qingshengii TaxID=1165689 RepID=A0A1G5ZYJ2_9HYPH|nr:hypothetical protein SAMN02927914_06717 [Mesorhizobium qingshengii]
MPASRKGIVPIRDVPDTMGGDHAEALHNDFNTSLKTMLKQEQFLD